MICMSRTIRIIMLMAFQCTSHIANATTPIYLKWSGSPLEIQLQVGVERRIAIPSAGNVRIGIPHDIDRILNTQVIGNHLWMTATESFATERIVVLTDSIGRLILSVHAVEHDLQNAPIVIQKKPTDAKAENSDVIPAYGFVTLTRWVVQQLYSPKRLLNELPGVVNTPVEKEPVTIFRCANRVPTPCAHAVTAVPIASWRSPYHYVTALSITNNLTEALILDPRELRGEWRTASFVHARLAPKGQISDNTVLVLISDYPFENPHL